MKLGNSCDNFIRPPHPRGIILDGEHVRLEPLSEKRHGLALYEADSLDEDKINWIYLKVGPYAHYQDYADWIRSVEGRDDHVFFAIIRKSDEKPVGVASYLRINQEEGTIEVGSLNFSPLLQKTTEATEAMYLMMHWAFENGYRRYEWKCNSLNIKSRRAAQRLGFSYEGVFRQMEISKGRNRDTAWFAIIDKEWSALKTVFQEYLSPRNYDEQGQSHISLSSLTKSLLYKEDDLDFS